MTRVKKSSLRNSRGRYNLYSGNSGYNRNNATAIVFSSLLFVVVFITYQLLASNSSSTTSGGDGGGPLSMAQRGSSFLKGRLQGGKQHHHNTQQHEDEEPVLGGEDSEDNQHVPNEMLKLAEDIFKDKESDTYGGNENEEVIPNKDYTFDTSHVIFNNYYRGKSGKVVEEILMAHAHAFQLNVTYGGCCASSTIKVTQHQELLEAIGLKDVLQFRCPHDYPTDFSVRKSVIPRDRYTSDDTRVWTPEYVEYIRSLLSYPPRQHKEYTIVVHMLRGETSPCRDKHEGYFRYLPNQHYQNLIDKYMKPGARVVIYTSPKSFEDTHEFRKRGYEVNVDATLKDTWKDFVTADVMIMSRSDFSMVPAMLAKGTVVYTPFWHHSLRRWKRVSKDLMNQCEEEIERLRSEMCQTLK
jgi:hypothetical protein